MRLRPSKSARVRSSTFERVEAGHVRAVAPDDAGQRRLQPPELPGAADQALRLLVDPGEFLRLLDAEVLGLLGVDAAEAKHRRDDVAALGEGRAGGGRDVEIAGGVDHDVAEDRLRARPWCRRSRLRRGRPRTIAFENQECSRTSTPASAIISFETRFQPSGSKAAAITIGAGFMRARKSKTPQRAHLR